MRYYYNVLAIIISMIILHGNSSAQKQQVVAEFGKYSIFLDEFEKAYAKNMGGWEEAKDDSLEKYKNFLDLYVNFRMKLRNAQVRGYDRDEDLIKEFDSYRKQVGSSYIIEKEIIEPSLRKYYEDQRSEIRVSHIMIRPEASFDEAKKVALEVIKKINDGGDFAQLAKEYSGDLYTKDIGGDIYWVTAGQVVPEFENAVFLTNLGEIYPEPIKTNYGYHIIKVTARQDRRYQLRARHILVSFSETAEDSSAALAKITGVLSKLNNGEDFGELAKVYSDDKGSGAKGGDLGFFSRRMMVKPFDETVFNLKVGERSGIVKTKFGYHIIELTAEMPFPSFDEMIEKLKDQYKKTRYDNDLESYTENLKQKYNYARLENVINDITNYKDTVRFDELYLDSEFRKSYKDKVIISLNSKQFIVDSVFSFGKNEVKVAGKALNRNNVLSEAVDLYSRKLLFDEAAIDLGKYNTEFASLMDDYKNGISIFRLQEEEVWDRVKVDSNDVKKYHDKNQNNYVFPDRVDFSEIMVHKDSVANEIYSQLMNGAEFDSLARSYTLRPTFKQKGGHHGIQEVSSSDLAEKAYSLRGKNDFSEPFKSGANWSIVKLNEKYPSRVKTYMEARAEVSSDYQEILVKNYEKEYIKKLNDLYKPQYNYDVLNNAFKDNIN